MADIVPKPAPAALTLEDFLVARRKHIEQVLPKHLTADRVIKLASLAWHKTPKLKECSLVSIFNAIVLASELGLEPASALGHAYLVPFAGECVMVPGYRGLIHLARQSGLVKTVEVGVIHQNDKYDIQRGLTPNLSHSPTIVGDPGPWIAVYAIWTLVGGRKQFDVRTKPQVFKIRDRSKGYQYQISKGGKDSPWITDEEEMAVKTVIKHSAKIMPQAELLARACDADDAAESIDVDFTREDGTTKATGTKRAKAALDARKENPEAELERDAAAVEAQMQAEHVAPKADSKPKVGFVEEK